MKVMWASDYIALPKSAGKGKIISDVEHSSDCPLRNLESTGFDPENRTICDIETENNHIELNISMKRADIYMTAELEGKYHKVRMPIWFCPFCRARVRYDGEEKDDTRPTR